jgi:hypothetical protein
VVKDKHKKQMNIKTSNDIESVGFPETQILPHVDGDFELCGKISAAYLEGNLDKLPDKDRNANDSIKNVCESLSKMQDYESIKM